MAAASAVEARASKAVEGRKARSKRHAEKTAKKKQQHLGRSVGGHPLTSERDSCTLAPCADVAPDIAEEPMHAKRASGESTAGRADDHGEDSLPLHSESAAVRDHESSAPAVSDSTTEARREENGSPDWRRQDSSMWSDSWEPAAEDCADDSAEPWQCARPRRKRRARSEPKTHEKAKRGAAVSPPRQSAVPPIRSMPDNALSQEETNGIVEKAPSAAWTPPSLTSAASAARTPQSNDGVGLSNPDLWNGLCPGIGFSTDEEHDQILARIERLACGWQRVVRAEETSWRDGSRLGTWHARRKENALWRLWCMQRRHLESGREGFDHFLDDLAPLSCQNCFQGLNIGRSCDCCMPILDRGSGLAELAMPPAVPLAVSAQVVEEEPAVNDLDASTAEVVTGASDTLPGAPWPPRFPRPPGLPAPSRPPRPVGPPPSPPGPASVRAVGMSGYMTPTLPTTVEEDEELLGEEWFGTWWWRQQLSGPPPATLCTTATALRRQNAGWRRWWDAHRRREREKAASYHSDSRSESSFGLPNVCFPSTPFSTAPGTPRSGGACDFERPRSLDFDLAPAPCTSATGDPMVTFTVPLQIAPLVQHYIEQLMGRDLSS
eukprot:TRINITY_DN26607_c0_g1_i1.p1 TRINITY_DN26607_c0_g1~~TRINITY_DN26607_c0_g1_i1.p1  ORF type:complete len:701 (+),score=141.98 TRINITY_DN26607_c0_g1_i1:286-2103(+)